MDLVLFDTLPVPDTDSPGGQARRDTHAEDAAGGSTSPQATVASTPIPAAPAGLLSPGHTDTPFSLWPEELSCDVSAAATTLDDIEKARIACHNRLSQFVRPTDQVDKDGEYRGFGWDPKSIPVRAQATLLAGFLCKSTLAKRILGDEIPQKHKGCCLEHEAERNLTRALRAHPLGPWVLSKEQKGIGPRQGGRLIGVIGDPYARPPLLLPDGSVDPARPRTVSELWAYCGLHVIRTETGGVAARRQKGQKANWSTAAKTRAMLIAESCKQQRDRDCKALQEVAPHMHAPDCGCSPYRIVYDRERLKNAAAVHHVQCTNHKRPPQKPNGCGTREHPEWGAPGSPWRPGHQERSAIRIAAKEILKDLWREARRIHEETPGGGQLAADTQETGAAAGD